MEIREAVKSDLNGLLKLYTYLHDNPLPETDNRITKIWDKIIKDDNHHILLGFENDEPICSCVLVIIENLTQGQQPYALIENVITHPSYRKKGNGTAVLNAACRIAEENNCYKVMLLTGSKQDNTLNFYRKAGFNSEDKTAFIKWYK